MATIPGLCQIANPYRMIQYAKLSEASFNKSEEIIYRVIRACAKLHAPNLEEKGSLKNIDKHSFDVFRKMAKTIEFVVPITGSNQRFILTPSLIRLFVYCLIKPSERIKMTDFLKRIYAHSLASPLKVNNYKKRLLGNSNQTKIRLSAWILVG